MKTRLNDMVLKDLDTKPNFEGMVGDSPPIMTLTKRLLVWVFIVMEKVDKITQSLEVGL
jgi:hypothetical protein